MAATIPLRILQGKTAAITGGTTGIGRAITLEYLRQGANVAVNHIDPHDTRSLLDEAAEIKRRAPHESGEIIHIVGDVTDPKTGEQLVDKVVKSWGGLDIFISNAGIFKAAEFLS